MSQSTARVAPGLAALLESVIDYAGVFPPAGLSVNVATVNYDNYKKSEYAWMLRWLVVNEAGLEGVPAEHRNCVSLLAEAGRPGVAAIESKSLVAVGGAEAPVYCEVGFDNLNQLDAIKKSGCYAKMRTGGLKPEAIPSAGQVAEFINRCADLELPFKATAGLHHPLRSMQALTYEADAPQAVMHGFINVLMASAFAWQGATDLEPILNEMDPQAFKFDDDAYWRGRPITRKQIIDMRANLMHSIGSCSFDEPVQDLRALGLFA
ncbi:MAG: hypothetical protein KGS72_21700 [Cyanobacteria bacterium REEB67]|nr:hypothetical protein [Cyanobacteria bacterium REEB67]